MAVGTLWVESIFREAGKAMRIPKSLIAVGAGLTLCTAASAHHSFAPFEDSLQITLSGTVTSFQWTNPHVYIELEAADDSGEARRWLIECANTTILNRVGWKWNMIREGDRIDVIVAPLRNGEPAALLKRVRLADGSEIGNGGPAGPATIDFDGKPLASAARPGR
jgi:hypothetical protein